MVVRPLAYRWIRGRVIAKSAGSGKPVFHRWMLYCTDRTVALRRPIFKRKKGFAAICLGLIYHSMVLSQLRSRDTVLLNRVTACFPRSDALFKKFMMVKCQCQFYINHKRQMLCIVCISFCFIEWKFLKPNLCNVVHFNLNIFLWNVEHDLRQLVYSGCILSDQ
jgi:hypothetical protein